MLLAVLLNFGVIGSLRTWYIHIERCIGCFHLSPCSDIMVSTAFLGAGQSAEGLQTVAFSPHLHAPVDLDFLNQFLACERTLLRLVVGCR